MNEVDIYKLSLLKGVVCRHTGLTVAPKAKVTKYCLTLPKCNNQPYPSDPGREGALSEELEEVETTEEANEVTDSLRSVEDRM